MRITVVSHYFASHRGGIEIVAERIAEALSRDHGFTIKWVASATPHPSAEPPAGVRYVPVGAINIIERMTGLPLPIWGPRGFTTLYRAVRDSDALVLHDTLYPGNVAAFVIAKLLGRPTLVIQHIGLVPYRNPVMRLCMRIGMVLAVQPILRNAERTVFISATTQAYFRARITFRRPDGLVFNGVDADTFRAADKTEHAALRASLGVDPESPLLLFVGRFVEKKGIAVLHRLAKRMTSVTWVLVGWGPLDPGGWQLDHLRVERDLSADRLAEWYRAADLLVLPSVGEGFPLVIQEAMACGTPALCSSDTAQADPAVAQYLHSAAVDECDPEATALLWHDRLQALLTNREALASQRAVVADLARRRWSWREAGDAYASILLDMAGKAPPSRVAWTDGQDVAT